MPKTKIELLEEMLDMQDAMNLKVHPDWRNQHFAWYRAIWTECAELMDKIGWKWWKHKVFDKAQARLELVDIWHFILSWVIQKHSQLRLAEIIDTDDNWHKVPNLLTSVEGLSSWSLSENLDFSVMLFLKCISHESIDLSCEELYRLYIGKNTLNFFRQDHGYSDGSYRKIWSDGREDNEHLADIINARKDSDDFAADVYQDLLDRYPINPAVLYS